MARPSRRDFIGMVTASAMLPLLGGLSGPRSRRRLALARSLRVRTITAGVGIRSLTDLRPVEAAIALLERGRKVFEAEDYEVQTLRIATPPVATESRNRSPEVALARLRALDELASARDVRVAIGPVLAADHDDPELPDWAAELARTTKVLNFTVIVSSPGQGTAPRAAAAAARTMMALAHSTPDGLANFRFAAAANIPAGTPFFPVAHHRGPDSLAIGMESASLVEEAFGEEGDTVAAGALLRRRLEEALAPVEQTAVALARREGRVYLGIDPSPAPGMDRSIGAAIEALTGVPFGGASTLDACAVVTGALKGLRVRTCGYAGLMLPVMEDPVLAKRATEGRYDVQDLLLYSSVCGTGLDVVPLLPAPGKRAGEIARFTDPYLTDAAVFGVQ